MIDCLITPTLTIATVAARCIDGSLLPLCYMDKRRSVNLKLATTTTLVSSIRRVQAFIEMVNDNNW